MGFFSRTPVPTIRNSQSPLPGNPKTYPYTPSMSNVFTETTNVPFPLPTPSYNPGTYTPGLVDAGPIPAPSYAYPSAAPAAAAPSDLDNLGGVGGGAPVNLPMVAADRLSGTGLGGGMPADLGGPPSDLPGLGPSGDPSSQSPGLAALQGLLGRSNGGVQSPGLQGLLEGTAGRLGGGQARQRYGRQFQTYLANQQAAQRQRAESAGMDSEMAPSTQGALQMQIALDRLRAALDLPSRGAAPRSRAPQFGGSSSSLGSGLSSSSTSPYLY